MGCMHARVRPSGGWAREVHVAYRVEEGFLVRETRETAGGRLVAESWRGVALATLTAAGP